MNSATHAAPYGRGLILVAAAATAWGTGGVVASVLYRTSGLGPFAISFWRAALGVALLAAVQVARRAPLRLRSGVGDLRVLLAMGLGLAVYQAAYYAAIAEAGVSIGTVATLGACPVLVALGGRLVLGERLPGRGALAIAFALGGLALLVGGATGASGPHPVIGVGAALASAGGYAVVTLLTRAKGVHGDGVATTYSTFFVGSVCLLPVAAIEGLVPVGHVVSTAFWLVFLGAVPTALAYTMFFVGLRTVPAAAASVIVLVEPVSAMALAVSLLSERPSGAAIAGSVLLLCAVAVLASTRRAERAGTVN